MTIAIVRLTTGDRLLLGDDGAWSVLGDATPTIRQLLDTLNADGEYSPRVFYTPALGAYGIAHAEAVARDFDGVVIYAFREPPPHGGEVVY